MTDIFILAQTDQPNWFSGPPQAFWISTFFMHYIRPGLPDGSFANQKSHFGIIFQGLRLVNIDIFYGHLEYFMDIWDIL
jgi:hypothetical protein